MNLLMADEQSLGKSRKAAFEQISALAPDYWQFLSDRFDGFWSKPASERLQWYLAHEPIPPFFDVLGSFVEMAKKEAAKMARDYAEILKDKGYDPEQGVTM